MSKPSALDELLYGKDKSDGEKPGFIANLIAACHDCARAAQSMPHGAAYDYYKAYPEFNTLVGGLKENLWDICGRVGGVISRSREAESFSLIVSDIDRFQALVETVDDALEEVTTRVHRVEHGNEDNSLKGVSDKQAEAEQAKFNEAGLQKASLQKPQMKFKTPVDNSHNPWRPTIREKPHALKPLDPVILNGLPEGSKSSYPHPYQYELEQLEYSLQQLTDTSHTIYMPLDATPCHWVDSLQALKEMEEKLCAVDCFAIDLEHHSYRSYLGFTCLMQVSTRDEDFLVDTLALRDELHILNSSFADPRIVKVLHGANMDILWLQRDLGLYVINMFDTGQAARLLDLKSFSLANLLYHFCGVKADKKYQTADWRLRPLSQDMLRYAREDTHYLLYIYDRLRQELIDKTRILLQGNANAANVYADEGKVVIRSEGKKTKKNATVEIPFLVAACLNRSRALCQATFEKELDTEGAALALKNRYQRDFSQASTQVFVQLYKWRDNKARELDESTGYILSNAMLFSIAKHMPADLDTLGKICRPMSPCVREHAQVILNIIQQVRQSTGVGYVPIFLPNPAGSNPTAMGSPVMTRDQLYRAAGWLTESLKSDPTITSSHERAARATMASAERLANGYIAGDVAALVSVRNSFDFDGIASAQGNLALSSVKREADTLDVQFVERASKSTATACMLGSSARPPLSEATKDKIARVKAQMHFETPNPPKKRVGAVTMSDEAEVKETDDASAPVVSADGLGEGIAAVEELNGVSWNGTDTTLTTTPKVGRLTVLQSPGDKDATLDDRSTAFSISQVYKLSNQNKLQQKEGKEKREREKEGESEEKAKKMKTDGEFMSSIGWTSGNVPTPTDATAGATRDAKETKEKTPFVYSATNAFTTVDSKALASSAKEAQQGFYNPYATIQGQNNIGKTRINGKKGGKK